MNKFKSISSGKTTLVYAAILDGSLFPKCILVFTLESIFNTSAVKDDQLTVTFHPDEKCFRTW